MKRLLLPALMAGLAGGIAEVAWIAVYSHMTETSGIEVAEQVAATIFPGSAAYSWAFWAGAGIHFALSLMIGLAFVLALWGLSPAAPKAVTIWTAAAVSMAGVWALNFLALLPLLNPAFVGLMPLAATLTSKISFGLAMSWVMTSYGTHAGRAAQP